MSTHYHRDKWRPNSTLNKTTTCQNVVFLQKKNKSRKQEKQHILERSYITADSALAILQLPWLQYKYWFTSSTWTQDKWPFTASCNWSSHLHVWRVFSYLFTLQRSCFPYTSTPHIIKTIICDCSFFFSKS